MFKLESQFAEIFDRLHHLQHSLQHGILSEIDDQHKRLNRFQRHARHDGQRFFSHFGRDVRHDSQRFFNRIGKDVRHRFDHDPHDKGSLALAFGVLALGGLGLMLMRQNKQMSENRRSLKSAAGVDLNRFAGKWFEIARLPGKHQDIAGMTLTYTLKADNSLDVVCCYHDHDLDGPEHTERKHIRIAEPDNRAHLKKQILGPIGTDYWILELGKNYEYAVLGTPSRKHLWILSRSPKIEEKRYQEILVRMKEQGFETDKLIKVKHDDHAPVALSSHLQALLDQKQQYYKGEQAEKHRGPQHKKGLEKREE